MRIENRLNVHTPPSTTSGAPGQLGQLGRPVNERVADQLFGHRPALFDAASASEEARETLAALVRMLGEYRNRLDVWAHEPTGRPIVLAVNTIAAIDQAGTIYLDASFLLAHRDELDLLVGVLAHEVGHRPGRLRQARPGEQVTPAELDDICRFEEIRADTFAGRALANLDLSVEPMIALLRQVQVEPHPRYLAVDQRAEVLRQAHRDGGARVLDERKFFPQMHRETSLRDLLGVG